MMMASVVSGGNRRRSLSLRGVDPETCMIVFKNHWAQVVKILEKHEPCRGSSLGFLSGQNCSGSGVMRLGAIPADEASAVQNYVEHMLFLLMEEEVGQGGAMGPILEFVVMEGVMERLFLWSLRRQFTEDMKLEQLRMYYMLLSQARQPLLHHKPVLRPLMMLLASCAGNGADVGGLVESELVLLLNQLCAALVRDPSVLELFFHTSEDQGAANFLLFSLLIPYTHRQGAVGQQARDALLLIMSLSASEPRVAQHIAENTYFCPVLATGLSGLYSSLPAKLQVYSEDWHSLEQADWEQVPALVQFLHSLDFCSTVIKVAHPSIQSQLLGYIYNGFLVPVLAPALHKLTVEEVMTTTAYLDLFLRCVSEPALLQSFLCFILLHSHDNVQILDTLVSRVNTPFQLGTVSLALFKTLIGLFCEDVMLQLVLRYLVPCSHLSGRERALLKERDCYSSSASSLLLLTPSWWPRHLPHSPHTEQIHWPKGADVSISEGDSVGYCRGFDFLIDVNYLHYLWDARLAISTSHRACLRWSAPYDGTGSTLQRHRSGTDEEEADEEEESEVEEEGGREEEEQEEEEKEERRLKRGDSVFSTTTPPLAALSPTPPSSSSEPLSTGHRTGRVGSALELEWDDMFEDEEEPSLSTAPTTRLPNGYAPPTPAAPASPPVPPRHIQEMRRSAIMLIRGSYVEESDFQDDVLVYDLIAQKDAKAVDPAARQGVQRGQTSGRRTVTETVNDIMTTHRLGQRRSEEGGREEAGRRSEGGGREERRHEEGLREVEERRTLCLTNGYSTRSLGEEAEEEEEERRKKPKCDHERIDSNLNGHASRNAHHRPHCSSETDSLLNSSSEFGSPDPSTPHLIPEPGDDFLSQYRDLMLSLGAEPDGDDELGAFRRRVQALRERQEEEVEDVDFNWRAGEEEEEEEEGEGRRDVPFTGPFISVLLSRLENLLDNSIAVNLLVTGILAQLASYPQPLLRSFLLNTSYRPTVRTLYQVLASVGTQIHQYVSVRPDYPDMVSQAWRFLLAKDQDSKIRESLQPPPPGGDVMVTGSPLLNGVSRNVAVPPGAWRGPTLPPCPLIPPQAKSRVFSIILYAEFLKELAAIAQEHSIAPDCAVEE